MKLKITKQDGTVIDLEGNADEVARAAGELLGVSPQPVQSIQYYPPAVPLPSYPQISTPQPQPWQPPFYVTCSSSGGAVY